MVNLTLAHLARALDDDEEVLGRLEVHDHLVARTEELVPPGARELHVMLLTQRAEKLIRQLPTLLHQLEHDRIITLRRRDAQQAQ